MISDLLNGSLLGPPCPQCPCSTDGVLDPHQADEVLLELRPSSSVLDLQLLGQLEERLRRCHHWMGAIKNRLVDR